MTQVTRNFYTPIYKGFLSYCGREITHEVKDRYPEGIERIVCDNCNQWFNIRFFPNDNGVMTMQLRQINS